MEGDPKPQGGRASLRGRGRAILLGQRVEPPAPPAIEPPPAPPEPIEPEPGPLDPAALKLSAQETRALLDFSPDSPVFRAEFTFPEEPRPVLAATAPRAAPTAAAVPETDEMFLAWAEELAAAAQAEEQEAPVAEYETPAMPSGAEPLPAAAVFPLPEPAPILSPTPEVVSSAASAPKLVRYAHSGDATPLAERDLTLAELDAPPYRANPAIEALIPAAPEQWLEPVEQAALPAAEPIAEPAISVDEGDHEGGQGVAEVASPEVPADLPESTATPVPDPFAPAAARLPAQEVFAPTDRADRKLLDLLVDDERIRRLADQIEALQEELATRFHANRDVIDAFQRELLEASGKLLATRENYDDARAIVYRVRTDMNRLRKINADIMRYRPLLLNYYIGWGIALGVLFLLKALFVGVTEAVGVQSAAAMYYPMLLGIAGALLSGLLTLERHTTRLRDFDPIHISWYLSNPLLGGVMGLLMFLLASIANEDLLRDTASGAEYAIAYLLCVVAGMNQNQVLRQLNDLLRRFGRGSDR